MLSIWSWAPSLDRQKPYQCFAANLARLGVPKRWLFLRCRCPQKLRAYSKPINLIDVRRSRQKRGKQWFVLGFASLPVPSFSAGLFACVIFRNRSDNYFLRSAPFRYRVIGLFGLFVHCTHRHTIELRFGVIATLDYLLSPSVSSFLTWVFCFISSFS